MTLPLPAQGVQEGDPGHISDHHAIANFLQQAAQTGALGTSAPYMPYNVRTYGAIGNGVTDDTTAILAAFQAAENNGGRKVIYFPTGTYVITGTLLLSGYSSIIRGDGPQTSAGRPGGTTLKCVSQTGPVLDFTGYVWSDYSGIVRHGGFSVVGDGTSDVAQVKVGINVPNALNAAFGDITISNTGGPPLKLTNANYCDFERLVITNPLGAKANDVAYLQANSISGCRFTSILFHSSASVGDVGASGAVLVRDASGGISSANNYLADLLFDTLHVPTGGSIVWYQGNSSILTGLAFAGCVKESGATATACIRLSAPGTNLGGNIVTGLIPGKGTGATDIDTGVDINQARNTVEGTKGFRGANVTLESGVGFANVTLRGGTGTSTDPGVIDNSGQLTNTLRDDYLGTNQTLNYTLSSRPPSSGGAGIQVADASNAQLGALYLGNQGAAVQNGSSEQKSMFYTGDRHHFRDSTKALLPLTLSSVSGEPSALAVASGTSPTALRSQGVLDFATDNTYDIGASGANRPRDVYAARNLNGAGLAVVSPTGSTTSPASIDATNTSSRVALSLIDGSLQARDAGPILLRKIYSGAGVNKTGNINGGPQVVFDTISIASLVTAGLIAGRLYKIEAMFNLLLTGPSTGSSLPGAFARVTMNTVLGSTVTMLKRATTEVNVGNTEVSVPILWVGPAAALIGQTSLQIAFNCSGNYTSGTITCQGSVTNPAILVIEDVGDQSLYTVV